jgi:sirohydrochlorin cobaltochelatase
MGEVVIARDGEGYELRHYRDAEVEGLAVKKGAARAREIALYDAAGKYRALKTAPNLRRGWRLMVEGVDELQEALDGFYPAMLGARAALEAGRIAVTPLRETLGRQSGMYAVTRKITDGQANELIAACCNLETGCLKKILWRISGEVAITSLPAEKFEVAAFTGTGERASWPMPCAEACNLLVAKAREVVKQTSNPTTP